MRRSLRSRITLVVLVCWSVPLLLIWLTSLWLSTNSLRERIDVSLRDGTEFAAQQASSQLDVIISMSRRASYDDAIYNAYLEVSGNSSPDILSIYTNVRRTLTNVFDRSSLVTFTAVYFHGYENYPIYYEDRVRRIEPLRNFYADMPAIRECSEKSGEAISFCMSNGRLYVVRNLLTKNKMKEFGTIVALINPELLTAPFSHLNLTLTSLSVRLANYRNENAIYYPGEAPDLEEFAPGNEILTRSGNQSSYAAQKRYQDYTLSYYIEIDYDDSYPELFSTMKLTGILILGVLPLLIYMLSFLHKQVTEPVRSLVVVAESIESGDFGVQTPSRSLNYEFDYLSKTVNSMSLRLKELFERVYREELRFKDAKIAALQAQINPHFFNNTLELINWQARRNGDELTVRLIESLSTLVSMAMDRSDTRIQPLKLEIDCVNAYLHIVSVRYGKRITIQRDIDESFMETQVPRMFMQPLVENAVVHSIDRRGEALVSIKIYGADSSLIIEIGNSGELSPDDKASIDSVLATRLGKIDNSGERRLGLANVYERLLLMYGSSDIISYRSCDEFTTIVLTIPIEQK